MRRLVPLCLLLATACSTGQPDVDFRPRPNSPGPFSEAVRVDDLLFLSGVLGTDSTGRLVPGGIRPETRQALENIKAALQRNGLTMAHVVKCTAMLADIADWPAMNEVYTTYFPGPKPARSAMGGLQLVFNARMELECTAAIP
ncbi:MAG: RidA family protein [Gemmatimonadaceae bacterium]